METRFRWCVYGIHLIYHLNHNRICLNDKRIGLIAVAFVVNHLGLHDMGSKQKNPKDE